MKKYFYLLALAILLVPILDSCNTARMSCPGFSSKRVAPKGNGGGYASMMPHHKKDKTKAHAKKEEAINQTDESGIALGGGAGGNKKAINVLIPDALLANLSEAEITNANELFKSESHNTVSLERSANNKVYFKAKSPKAVTKVLLKQIKKAPAPAAPGGGGDGLALAGGIMGIIAIVFAFLPYVGYLSLILAILAIVFGALGLRSSRRGWAITGIVLGAITLLLALLFLFLIYSAFLFF